jgi:hypothetical protein
MEEKEGEEVKTFFFSINFNKMSFNQRQVIELDCSSPFRQALTFSYPFEKI